MYSYNLLDKQVIKESNHIYNESFLIQPTEEKLKENVNWVYNIQKFANPKIYIFDSPTIAQYGFSFLSHIDKLGAIPKHKKRKYQTNIFIDTIYKSIFKEIDILWDKYKPYRIIKAPLFPAFNDNILNHNLYNTNEEYIEDNETNNIFLQKCLESLNEQLDNPISFKIKNHKTANNIYCLKNFSHIAKIVILINQNKLIKNQEELEYVNKVLDILSNGLNVIYASPDAIILCKNPLKILFDEKRRLHSTHQSAVEWKKGEERYCVHGVHFEKEIFNKAFKNKNITPEEIMSLNNLEQKAVIIQEYGFEYIVSLLKNKKTIHSYTEKWNDTDKEISYHLFECELGKNRFDMPTIVRLLKVEWWENNTKRKTVLGIPRRGDINTCKQALAWTFGLKPEEYKLEQQK